MVGNITSFAPHFKTEVEYDPLGWSDSDGEQPTNSTPQKIDSLEKKLALSERRLEDYRSMMAKTLGLNDKLAELEKPSSSNDIPHVRDDDSHYFRSYSDNGK